MSERQKVMISDIVAGVAVSPAIFLVMSFVQWDINPANWDIGIRAFTAFFCVGGSILAAVGLYMRRIP